MNSNVWKKYDNEKRKVIESYCDDYKEFLSVCKTERETIIKAIEMAEKKGYISLDNAVKQNKKLGYGDKVYAVNMNKAIVLINIGKQSFEKGINIVGSHIDSPRLDLKADRKST